MEKEEIRSFVQDMLNFLYGIKSVKKLRPRKLPIKDDRRIEVGYMLSEYYSVALTINYFKRDYTPIGIIINTSLNFSTLILNFGKLIPEYKLVGYDSYGNYIQVKTLNIGSIEAVKDELENVSTYLTKGYLTDPAA